jgi:signal transduction histidine kinase/CheY-like chemotaxis protein
VFKKIPKLDSLAVKIPLLFVGMLLVMMVVFLLVMEHYGNHVLLDVAKHQVRQSGESIVATLGRRLIISESTVNAMANAAESIPAIEKLHHQVIKPIVDNDADHFIAGGGIWPEPYLYDTNRDRRSFFWGRNQEGVLEYFDDYNDPKGSGYHHEEWYAPARLLKQGQVYWSRSYMDPYSFESMVTVTAPMFKKGQFYGAATLDLSLDGMNQLLSEESAKFGGYAYVLDRNGTFISYPDESVSKQDTVLPDGTIDIQFTKISDAVKNNPNIHDVTVSLLKSEAISRINQKMIEKAQALASDSYQINTYEAHRIISTLEDPLKTKSNSETFLKEFSDEYDPIIKKPVIINVFHMPKAYWKVITVTPLDRVTQTSDRITKAVVIGFIFVIVLGLLIGLLSIQIILINPLRKMRLQVSDESNGIITEIITGELGDLANRFNDNNLALRSANIELGESVVKARDATIAKAQFLANMSHEIRTPMNGVSGMLELLKSSELTEQQRHYTSVASTSAQSLLVLINDILDFSKIESGKLDIEFIEFNIRDKLNELISSMLHLAEQKKLELMLDLSGLEVDNIKSDQGRIGQILTNLISNAIKFTSDGHVLVKISIKDVNELGLILYGSVTDTGIGVKPDKIATLFDSFTQVDASTTRTHGGTGLGLSICKQLCELMNGSISMKSEYGEGSRFEFTLLLEKSENKLLEVNKSLLKDKRFLIYQNTNNENRALIRFLIDRGGKIQTGKYATVIISDLNLERFDYLFIDIIRATENDKTRAELKEIKLACNKYGTQLIGLTAVISPQYTWHYTELGCDQVILVPFTDEALDAMLNKQAIINSNTKLIDDRNFYLGENSEVDDENNNHKIVNELVIKKRPLSDAKILLVEDNMINQEVALGLLSQFNIVPYIVGNGLEAVNVITDEKHSIQYDMVIMDCQMPVMDGYEATRQVRKYENKNKKDSIPIIAMTANAMKGDKEKCIEAGMSDYIPKPINPDLLKSKIIEWFV